MKIKKTAAKLTAFLLAVCMLGTTALAYDGVYTDKDGNISYEPTSRGPIPTAAIPSTRSLIPPWAPERWTAS